MENINDEALNSNMGGALRCGDCLGILPEIADKSIDMVLCDLPYGTTSRNKWDSIIPLDKLWEEYRRVIKDNGVICLFAQQPFLTDLINANRKDFRYEIIWQKTLPVGFLNANRMPLRAHENIAIFYKKLPKYNPQFSKSKPYGKTKRDGSINYGYFNLDYPIKQNDGKRYPIDVIVYSRDNPSLHPTQKPVKLCEYLIKTYTDENEIVLDNCLGSGTTAIACINTNRRYIGIEKDEKFFKLSEERIIQTINDKQTEENQT